MTQPATTAPPTASATQSSSLSNAGNPDSFYAVQNTCRNGLLYNYATANGPVSVGATSLTNAVNTGNASATPAIAPILDYTAIPGAYVVLPSTVQIANESAMKRGDATPIFYQLKISQNGRLSLAYATCPPGSNSGCSAFSSVITGQNITTSNGPLPANFLFGFAGSTGGANNIHEILCFRADPATSASSSAGASEKQSAKLENGIQAYFAYYNPSNGWTGRVTASSLGFDGFGNVVIGSTPNWDASCVLTGVPSGSTCATTGQAGLVNAQNPDTGRSILSWNGSTGVAFRYANLSAGQQTAIDSGDSGISGLVCNASTAYSTADRVNFLRGDALLRGELLGRRRVPPPHQRAGGRDGLESDLGGYADGPLHGQLEAIASAAPTRCPRTPAARPPTRSSRPTTPSAPRWCTSAPTTACCTASAAASTT